MYDFVESIGNLDVPGSYLWSLTMGLELAGALEGHAIDVDLDLGIIDPFLL